MITITQIKAAMGMLGWTDGQVADKLGITTVTLRGVLTGKNKKVGYITNLQSIFEIEGLEFIESNGVRERPSSSVQTLEGQEGYWQFYDDIYETIKKCGGEILVSNVEEKHFKKWLGEKKNSHTGRMIDLLDTKGYEFKILVREGDRDTPVTSYAEYRWMPKDQFSNIPFYVYGNKLAIIDFEEKNVSVFIINNPRVTNAYKKQFNAIWDQSKNIPKKKK